jgi:ferredoxin
MRFQVDLDTCQNHGQCCAVAPAVFSLDEETRELAFRRQAEHCYISPELDESLRDDVTTASEMCPTQAIEILD